MDNSTLNSLLQEYSLKRQKAIEDSNNRKKELYSKNKRLEEIEKELNKCAISSVKSILVHGQTSEKQYLEKLNKKIHDLNLEKEKILKSLGKDLSYLEPVFNCPICKDTGYVTKNYKTEMCNCLKQEIFNIEYNKSNISGLQKENFSTFNINKYSDKVDKEKYHSDISPRENILNIKKIVEKFIDNFDNPEEKNLLFIGNTGLGKTFLSNAIAYEILKKRKTVLYQTASNMLDAIIDYRFNKTTNNIYDTILNVNLLIIDDLGTETMNNMKFTELFNIINTRILNQENKITKTIISTNLNLENIFSYYDERIVSRFVGYYNICRFFGEDIRFMK